MSPDPALAEPLEVVERIRKVAGEKAALHEPEIGGNAWAYVKDCLDTGWVSTVGAYVDRFEKMLCEITGARHAIATVNGTAALHIALVAAGVRPGDEVITPSLTFVATCNALAYCGASPHFIDIEETTLGIDPAKLAARLDEAAILTPEGLVNRETGRPIRAVVPMHCFGHSVDLDPLLAVCAEWGLVLVEDAAESLGSFYKGRHTGTFGLLGTLSFNGNKVVTTGGGGAILTGDPEVAKRVKHLTTTAKQPHAWAFVHDEVGYNYRLPNINAALGCAQLELLSDFVARKRRVNRAYGEAFADLDGVRLMGEQPFCTSNFWLNALVLTAGGRTARDEVLAAANQAGLTTRPAWTPMHELRMFADAPRGDLAVTTWIADRLISLPSSSRLGGPAAA